MKTPRADFKNALRFCKNNEMKIRKKALLLKIRDKNKIPFLKEVRRVTGTHKNVLTCIDGKTDSESITQLFDARYKEFLNYSDGPEGSSMSIPSQHSSNMQHGSPVIFLKDLNLAINSVNSGSGWDMVRSENLKLGGKVLGAYCANCLTKLFCMVMFLIQCFQIK